MSTEAPSSAGEKSKNSTPFHDGRGKFGKGNPGKPKGAVSKVGKAAKEVIAEAAESLGGAKRLVAWAKEDPLIERAFWSNIYPKLLPMQVTGAGANGAHEVILQVVGVATNRAT